MTKKDPTKIFVSRRVVSFSQFGEVEADCGKPAFGRRCERVFFVVEAGGSISRVGDRELRIDEL